MNVYLLPTGVDDKDLEEQITAHFAQQHSGRLHMNLNVVAFADAQLQHRGADFSCKDIFREFV